MQEKYGPDLYTHANVAISGTHTHSGPAGFLQYILFQVSSMGSVQDTVEAFVGGITLVSLGKCLLFEWPMGKMAHKKMKPYSSLPCPFNIPGLKNLLFRQIFTF